MNNKEIILKYHTTSVKLNNYLLLAGILIVCIGFLLFWFAENQVYRSFAIGMLLITPLFLLKALIDRNRYLQQLKNVEQSVNITEQLIYIDQSSVENEKHKKVCIYLLLCSLVVGVCSLITSHALSVWLTISSVLLILALEYINNTIEDYRLYEYKYQLEREDS